jgi:hypothetical protein
MGVKQGQRTFNFGLKTTKDNAEQVEKIISTHAAFMRENHSLDDSKIQVIHYYVSKSEEFNNPANPDEGTTGNMLYTINEVYVHPEGIGQHMEAAMAWDGIQDFMELLGTYGEVLVANGEVIETL